MIPKTLPAIRSDFLYLAARLATASAAVCAPLDHRSGETSSSNDLKKKAYTRVQVESYDRTLSRIAKLSKTSRQKSFTAPSDTKVSAIPASNCFDPTLLVQSRYAVGHVAGRCGGKNSLGCPPSKSRTPPRSLPPTTFHSPVPMSNRFRNGKVLLRAGRGCALSMRLLWPSVDSQAR